MAILGKLLKNGIRLGESLEQDFSLPIDLQKAELRKLLIHGKDTHFGKKHKFSELLKTFKKSDNHAFYEAFKDQIPTYDYDKIYQEWWHLAREGQSNVSWPGKVKYFALSSGTSGAASKYIPITSEMLKSIKRTSIRQILSLSRYDLPEDLFTKGILMLGGSTHLRKNGHYFEGDLSGITASNIPFWFQHFYKPGKKIAKSVDWGDKLDEITKKARQWDIGIIVGVPAWLQILIEKIVKHYQVKHIHEIWPNLSIFVHGGVSFEPYKKGFQEFLGKPLIYMETYLASEGFLAFQALPDRKSMRLVLNNGIFYEFIPFTDAHFDENGEMRSDVKTLKIDEVEANKEYALLITTNAGAWRYLIGDTVKFVSIEDSEIVITGRTKHFLSLCGEHLSLDNMNKAIELLADEQNIHITEFTVAGVPHDTLFAHHWYIGTHDQVDNEKVTKRLDQILCDLNDDYATERKHALKEIRLQAIAPEVFYDWMRRQGKEGGQNKFPRVLKKEKLASWQAFLEENNL